MSELWEVLEELYDEYWLKREEGKNVKKMRWKQHRIIFLLTLFSLFVDSLFLKIFIIIIEIIYTVYSSIQYLNYKKNYKKKIYDYYHNNSRYEDDHIEYRKYDERLR